MLTARGWWCLLPVFLMVLVGVLFGLTPLAVTGLALLLWFAWEWLSFVIRVRTVLPRLRVERVVGDGRGALPTLWGGRTYEVRVALRLHGPGRLPYVVLSDPVPFAVEYLDGTTSTQGEVAREPLEVRYRIRCGGAGQVRFEGVRVEVADLQGFFYHAVFVRQPAVYRVLPDILVRPHGRPPGKKQHNQLLPPGVHRLRQPGSGSELLDLRDYLPGDPPRTIAWKVSARRGRLITKEFESEVPVRCTLFLDTSTSVRLPYPRPGGEDEPGREGQLGGEQGKPLDRLVEVSAAVLRANSSIRDLTGLCVFDESGSQTVRPDRTGRHQTKILELLADAGALAPAVGRAEPDGLLPSAYSLAQEVYPELLRAEINAMPVWLTFLIGFPRYRRRWRGLLEYLHRTRLRTFVLGLAVPSLIFLLTLLVLLLRWLPRWAEGPVLWAALILCPLAIVGTWLVFLGGILLSGRHRRVARWRKRLAALLAVRHALPPGGVGGLLEDDDQFSLHLQRFLAEHGVPYAVTLYDPAGRYLGAAPGKVEVLATALLEAVGKGHDNELFVLLVDVLELDEHLGPLLQAMRVALGRHHQVVLVCPWPPGLELPGKDRPRRPLPAGHSLHPLMSALTRERLHEAYHRIRRTCMRLGVSVVCAGSDESVPLILDRIERLRSVGGRR
jgi:uncharacterized protein (DUF58 family)